MLSPALGGGLMSQSVVLNVLLLFLRPLSALSVSEARWCLGCFLGAWSLGRAAAGAPSRKASLHPSRVPLACVRAALLGGTLLRCVPSKGSVHQRTRRGRPRLHHCAFSARFQGGRGPGCSGPHARGRGSLSRPSLSTSPPAPPPFSSIHLEPFDCDKCQSL